MEGKKDLIKVMERAEEAVTMGKSMGVIEKADMTKVTGNED